MSHPALGRRRGKFAGRNWERSPHARRAACCLPKNISADAAYGSEENYAYVEQHQLDNFLKYNTFYQDTHHYRDPDMLRAHQFRAEHFRYDATTDEFICPAEKRLTLSLHRLRNPVWYTPTANIMSHCLQRLSAQTAMYARQGQSPYAHQFPLLAYRRQAQANLTSEEGLALRRAVG